MTPQEKYDALVPSALGECEVDATGEPTNLQRARWAVTALEAFNASNGDVLCVEEDVQDLITDLLHLLNHCGIDALVVEKVAVRNFDNEARGAWPNIKKGLTKT